MTTASLKEKPVRDLARLAKQHGVLGWHAMRKDQLIRALVRKARSRQPVAAAARLSGPVLSVPSLATVRVPLQSPMARAPQPPRSKPTNAMRDAAVAERIQDARDRLSRAKNMATRSEHGRSSRMARDRMVIMVRGPHWLHAFWEVTPRSIARAQAALGQEWHGARPVLRLLEVENGIQASPSERVVRTIEVHGGVKNWFIDIRTPLRCRVEIGYLALTGRFHLLARSNSVATPTTSQVDALDSPWGDMVGDCEKIYAMSGGFSSENNSTELQELFEERLQRPMGPPVSKASALDTPTSLRAKTLHLDVGAEMIVYGTTQPGAYVTLHGEPVKVQSDGTFRVRVDMPNKRQVLPIVASTADGSDRQTVVLAVERNTKSMELLSRESGDCL